MNGESYSIDRPLVDFLASQLTLEVLVETGNGAGRAIGDLFQENDLLELSATRPPTTRPTMFVLGDYSGNSPSNTPAEQCPLLEELRAIDHVDQDSVILITNARLIGSAPAALEASWPDLDDVVDGLRKLSGDHRLVLIKDSLVFFPASIKQSLAKFSCEHIVEPSPVEESHPFQPAEENLMAKENLIAGLVSELDSPPKVEEAGQGESADPIERVLQKLESVDSRLARIESRQVSAARTLLSRYGPSQLILRIKRPPVLRFQQHKPRKLSIPNRYATQTAPRDWPQIGIVTPSYNHARFLGATVDSVLGQNCPTLAYRVQDGASTDTTPELLASYGSKLQWRSEPDSGQSQAINLGFAEVECDIMAYLNSDDVLLPGALAYVAKYFAAHPEVDLIYSHRISIDSFGQEIGRAILPPHDAEVLKWADFVPQETLFWRRQVWDALEGIDESFRFAMDWDFLLRAQQKGFKIVRVPRFLGCFRVHDAQKTSAISDVGAKEMDRLKLTHLGYVPAWPQTKEAIKPYLIRHLIHQWLFLLRVLRY